MVQFDFFTGLAKLIPHRILDDPTMSSEFAGVFWLQEQSVRMQALLRSIWPQCCTIDTSTRKKLGSIIYHIKKEHPEEIALLLKEYPQVHIDELFSKSLKPSATQTYNSRYVHPLPIDKYDTIILQSQLNTGKTSQVMGNIELGIEGMLSRKIVPWHTLPISRSETGIFKDKLVFQFPRVLFLSARKSFTNFAYGESIIQQLGFNDYQAHSKEKLSTFDRLFLQVESLHKLTDGFQPYDICILDEVATILAQLNSVETNRTYMIENHIIFERIVSSCKKLFVADAFISDRSFSLVKHLRNPERTIYIENEHVHHKRKAFSLVSAAKDKRIPHTNAFVKRIMDAIHNKRRIVIVWTSKRKGQAFADEFLKPLPNLKWKFYHGESTKKERDDLKHVNEVFPEIDVLMYTTCISVGVSYNPSDASKHFDEIFLYACASSAIPRDIAQSLDRCRHMKLERLTFVCDLRVKMPNVCGIDVVTEFVADKKKRLIAEHPIVQWKSAPKWAEENYIYNLNEVSVSKSEYVSVLHRYLATCGYEIFHVEDDSDDNEYGISSLPHICFDDVPLISTVEYEHIKKLMERDEAKPIHRLQLKKYYISQSLKPEHAANFEVLWHDMFEKRECETQFWNVVREKHQRNISVEASIESNTTFVQMASNRLLQRCVVSKVLHLLGMTNSQEHKIVLADQMKSLTPEILKFEKDIARVFGLKRRKKTDGKYDLSRSKTLLQTVLREWSGTKVKSVNARRRMKNGVSQRVYDYEISPSNNWWDMISDYNGNEPADGLVNGN